MHIFLKQWARGVQHRGSLNPLLGAHGHALSFNAASHGPSYEAPRRGTRQRQRGRREEGRRQVHFLVQEGVSGQKPRRREGVSHGKIRERGNESGVFEEHRGDHCDYSEATPTPV